MIMQILSGLTEYLGGTLPKDIPIQVPQKTYEQIREQLFREVSDLAFQSAPSYESYKKLQTLSIVTNGITVHITAKK